MPGLFGLLGIVFIVLKLVGVIAWSWFWVLAPFWGVLVLVFLVWAIALSFAATVARGLNW
jgi:hypothetical protein